jgi:superfamily II DNA or RNA helicase
VTDSGAALPDSMLLDAAYVPPAPGMEPGIALFPPVELSPGQWRRAESALEIPEFARRLTLAIGDPSAPRYTPTRMLMVGDAVSYLMSLTGRQLRPSVTAWVIASHLAQRMHEGSMKPRGDASTDASLHRVAASMPESSYSVLVEAPDEGQPLAEFAAVDMESGYARCTAEAALGGFLDTASRALALGLTERSMAAPKRSVARTLTGLQLALAYPQRGETVWPMTVDLAASLARDAAVNVLAHAGSMVPAIAEIDVPERCPEVIRLSSDQASALLSIGDDLAARGAKLELPAGLGDGLDRLMTARVRIGRKSAGGSGASRASRAARFRLDDLVSYDLDIALGDQHVDAATLRAMARDARSLLQVGDEWVSLTDVTREQLEKLARVVESHDTTMANAAALAAALSGTAQLPGGIEATVDAVDDELLDRALGYLRQPTTFPQITPPENFTGELRGYQAEGLSWLAGMASLPLGACLADDMGLGKTVQVIALLAHLQELEQARDTPVTDMAAPKLRALVVCPTSLIGNWERELTRFAPHMRVHVHHGPQRTTSIDPMATADVTVTSFGLVARDVDLLQQLDWDVLIFDEAQSVKNPDTEQARAVRSLRGRFRIALTGTPMENRLLELWAILDLLNPGLLGKSSAFSRRFAIPIERGADEDAARVLRAITRPFMLRRVKHDPLIVPDLPDKDERTVVCTLTPEQAALYTAVAEQALADVRSRDGIGRRGAVLALLTRLKQVCNHPMQALGATDGDIAGRSGKLDRLDAMLEEVVAEGDRALVFTQYAQMGDLLARHLPDRLDCNVLYLHGGVPRLQREALVQQFQAESDEPMVFVLSLKAGGLGLNLMQAAHVFHYDRWWNPAVEDQATDRTHRIGQTQRIQVHKLVCAGTLEERIAQIIDEKRALAGRIIEVRGQGEGWVTELNDDELEALVSLSSGAVVDALSSTGAE